jgi:AcrR family transcriptional regulator
MVGTLLSGRRCHYRLNQLPYRARKLAAASAKRLPWPTRRERVRQRGLKREAVLYAAVQSFNERGFHSTSLDDVAASLNVTKPTVYYYFANKDEILFECVRLGLESIRDAAKVVETTGGSGFDRLTALMRDYAIIMTQDFGMCVTRTADHELSQGARARFRALKREIDDTVRRVIEDGMKDGSIRADDARMTTFTITGALNWIARWFDPSGPLSREEVAEKVVGTAILAS